MVNIWNNQTSCDFSQQDIRDLTGSSKISLITHSKYVNLNEIDKTIINYSDNLGSWTINPIKPQMIIPTIQSHEVILEDSLFFYFKEPEAIKFNKIWERESVYTYQFDNQVEGGNVGIPTYPFVINISLDNKIYQYKRRVLTIFEVTGFLGGIFEIFEVLFGFIIGTISSYSFKNQIVEELKESRADYLRIVDKIDKLQKKEQLEDKERR